MKLRATTAVVYSDGSRNEYVRQAKLAGEIYSFPSAYGCDRQWLKGEYAYLAVNAMSTVLHRVAIKHDIVTESEFLEHQVEYFELFVPNAGFLSQEFIDALTRWMELPGRFLFASGKTNLPPALLGLSSYESVRPAGYTGWRWTTSSPFASRSDWGDYHVSGYRKYACNSVRAADHAVVLADLYEFTGDLASERASTKQRLGDGIVTTDRSIYVANQLFEFLGGVLQAHINVEDVRLWNNPTHWGDRLVYFVREILQTFGPESLWRARLQPFGTYNGVLQLRHDIDHEPDEAIDLSMLEYQVQNAVPASYYVMDPCYCTTRCTELGSRIWIEEAAKYNFVEVGQHNDSADGDPPTWIVGQGLHEHLSESDLNLGLRSRTAGRHMGFLVYPETIDAMDYLYEQNPDVIGLCTFSLYDMLAYGERDPEVVVLGKQLTYVTYDHDRPSIPAAVSGYWFPYNVVVSTVDEHKQLRGWDVTHDTDCDFERIEALFDGQHSHNPAVNNRLENGVFTLQYETQLSRNPHTNQSRGHLPWMRYAIAYAERHNFWTVTKAKLYERMNDYRDIIFRPGPDAINVYNPTARRISGLVVEIESPSTYVTDGDAAYIHIVNEHRFTLPPFEPGEQRRVTYDRRENIPLIAQPNSRFLELTDARYFEGSATISVAGKAIRQSHVVITNLAAERIYLASVTDNRGTVKVRLTSNSKGSLVVPIFAPHDSQIPFDMLVWIN